MFQRLKIKLSGSADLIEKDDTQTLEIVKEAVQRSPYFQQMLRINLLSAMMAECPEIERPDMRRFYRRGINRFLYQMFEVELPEWQKKSDS